LGNILTTSARVKSYFLISLSVTVTLHKFSASYDNSQNDGEVGGRIFSIFLEETIEIIAAVFHSVLRYGFLQPIHGIFKVWAIGKAMIAEQ